MTRKEIWSDELNDNVDAFFDVFASIVGNLASNIAPLGAGILPAVMTYEHVVNVLGYSGDKAWVGWAAALVVEFMGMGAGQEAMIIYKHNLNYQHQKTEKNRLPLWAPMTAAVWYVLIMIAFNVLLEVPWLVWFPARPWVFDAVKIVSQALFALLAIPAYTLIAAKTLRKEQSRARSGARSGASLQSNSEQPRADGDDAEQGGANDDNSTVPVEQPEVASQYAEKIQSILENWWSARREVPSPTQIVELLNTPVEQGGYGAKLDKHRSSGYISTYRKGWIEANPQLFEQN